MKKTIPRNILILIMTMIAAVPVSAIEKIDGSSPGLFGKPTSIDEVTTVGEPAHENDNIDRSKDSALIPPPFGSGSSKIQYPAQTDLWPGVSDKFTLPDGLYYSDDSIGTLKIPVLNLDVKVFEDENLENLKKGAGHFKSTSCWDGNIGIAAHNRGAANYFANIHTLKNGNQITYTTKLGTRIYEVYFVGEISETDFSRLGRSDENIITLITCVRDVPFLRWCVQARET